MQNPQEVQSVVEALRATLPDQALKTEPLGLILGTGLSGAGGAVR